MFLSPWREMAGCETLRLLRDGTGDPCSGTAVTTIVEEGPRFGKKGRRSLGAATLPTRLRSLIPEGDLSADAARPRVSVHFFIIQNINYK